MDIETRIVFAVSGTLTEAAQDEIAWRIKRVVLDVIDEQGRDVSDVEFSVWKGGKEE